jgi:hypothetical protein
LEALTLIRSDARAFAPNGNMSLPLSSQRDDSTFVQLNREFVRLADKPEREEAADNSYLWARYSGTGTNWEKLLQRRLVVVLGEPGSGKTEELRQKAAELTAGGQPAFFIRLDELVQTPFETVLGPKALLDLNAWRTSRQPVTFFLDSVDESKLIKASDFHTALRRFREAIGPVFLPRTRVILSSRISEWHPETDGAEVCATFGVQRPSENRKDSEPSSLLVVQLAPLDREQVEKFARARKIPNAEKFLQALDDAYAWEFARRPIDVIALAAMWAERNKIGTLTEMVEFDIDLKLRETRSHSSDLLTAAEARAGAEALAAAAVFGHQFSIKVPDNALVVSESIDGRGAVPDSFTDDKYHMLLTRPLFDGASFGRIRFHHRRIREYLAAQWILKRMDQGCPVDELDALFFSRQDGARVIRSSLGAVAPWICGGTRPWNQAMRQWLLEAAPSLYLRHGDPQSLTLPEKRAVLLAVVERNKGRQYAWLNADEDAVARLADPALAPEISGILLNKETPQDLRQTMFTIIIRGKLVECLDAALSILADSTESDTLRNYAGIALRESALPDHKRRWAEIVTQATDLPMSVAHAAVKVLLPEFLTDQAALDLLMKARNTRRDEPELPRLLSTKLQAALRSENCGALLAYLIDRLRQEPQLRVERGEFPLSQEFGWCRALAIPITMVLLRKSQLSADEITNASSALWIACSMQADGSMDEGDLPALEAASAQHPEVRRHLLWQKILAERDESRPDRQFWKGIFWRNEVVMQPTVSDIEWLITDISERTSVNDRLVALNLALENWKEFGRLPSLLKRIEGAVALQPDLLLPTFNKSLRAGRFLQVRHWWYFSIWRHLSSRFWWERQWERLRTRYYKIRNRVVLSLHVRKIARGDKDNLIFWLINHAERGQGSLWSSTDWPAFEASWGPLITRATRAGLKGFWRRHVPSLPHEKPEPNRTSGDVVLGLTGLHLVWDAGEFNTATITDAEATQLTRYAVNELNGFPPWFPALLASKPFQVGAVLSDCVRGEWAIQDDNRERWDVLYRLAWSAHELDALTRSTMLDLLAAGDPAHLYPLHQVLTALFNLTDLPASELRIIAASRFPVSVSESPSLAAWFTVWVQLDPLVALDAWENRLCQLATADDIITAVCAGLNGRDARVGPRLSDQSYLTAAVLGKFVTIVARHVRFSEDVHRVGSYSPGNRDFAQEFRESLFRRLADLSDPAAADVLAQLAEESALISRRDYLRHLREDLLERLAEVERWRPADVRRFEKEHETDPYTDFDLYRIGRKRLRDIKNDVERSDTGLRSQLSEASDERNLRIWLANQLRVRGRNRYTVPQEVEIDRQQHPDIRLENPRAGYVPIEIKLASEWSLSVLLERLENQLFGQYLRAHDGRYGFFVLGLIDPSRQWDNPAGGTRLTFEQVIALLETRAAELSVLHGGQKLAEVVALDFRERC